MPGYPTFVAKNELATYNQQLWQQHLDEDEEERRLRDEEAARAATERERARGESLSLEMPGNLNPGVAAGEAVTPPPPAPSPAPPPAGQRFSPYDDVFRRHAGDLANNDEFISIVAAGTNAESGWNPRAVGDRGASVGLFQMHERGAGSGMSFDQRADPDTASARMVPVYAQHYQRLKAQGLTGAELASAVAAAAERPEGWDDPRSQARNNYRQAYSQVTGTPFSGFTSSVAPVQPSPDEEWRKWSSYLETAPPSRVESILASPTQAPQDDVSTYQDYLSSPEAQPSSGLLGPTTLSKPSTEVGNPLQYLQSKSVEQQVEPNGFVNTALGLPGDLARGARDFATQKIPGVGGLDEAIRGGQKAAWTQMEQDPNLLNKAIGKVGNTLFPEGFGPGAVIEGAADVTNLLPMGKIGQVSKFSGVADDAVKAIDNVTPLLSRGPSALKQAADTIEREAAAVMDEAVELPLRREAARLRETATSLEASPTRTERTLETVLTPPGEDDAARVVSNTDMFAEPKEPEGVLREGTGRWPETTPDRQKSFDDVYYGMHAGDKPATMSWEENAALGRSRPTPTEALGTGELGARIEGDKAEVNHLWDQVKEEERRLFQEENSGGEVASGAWESLAQSKVALFERLIRTRQDAGEIGRGLNFLKYMVEEARAPVERQAMIAVQKVARQLRSPVERAAKTGSEVGAPTRERLTNLRDKLEQESGKTGKNFAQDVLGKEEGTLSPTDDLARQIYRLNVEIGNSEGPPADRADLIARRQELLDELRALVDEQLRTPKPPKEGEDIDPTQEVERVQAQKILAVIRRQAKEDTPEWQKMNDERQGLQYSRRFSQNFVKERIKEIQDLIKSNPSIEGKREAAVLLDELATTSGWADQEVARVREKLLAIQPKNRWEKGLAASIRKELDRPPSDVAELGRLRSEIDRLLDESAPVPASLQAQYDELVQRIDEKARTSAAKWLEKQNEAPTRENVFEQVGKPLANDIKRRAFQEVTGSDEEEKAAKEGRKYIQEDLKATIDVIDKFLRAAPDSTEYRTLANDLLTELETTSGWAAQRVQNYRELLARQTFKRFFPDVNLKDANPDLLKRVAAMNIEDPRAVQQLAEELKLPPDKWEQLNAYRTASLLSSSTTMFVNASGNALMTAEGPLKRTISGVIQDAAMTVGGKPQFDASLDGVREVAGINAVLADALREFADTLKTGISSAPLRDLSTRRTDPVPGPLLGFGLNVPLRTLAATDDFFRTLAKGMAVKSEIARYSRETGIPIERLDLNLLGPKYSGRVGRGALNRFEHLGPLAEVLERATTESRERVFQAELGDVGKGINQMRTNPAVHALLPFFNTLYNVTKQSYRHSPLGATSVVRSAADPNVTFAQTADRAAEFLIGTALTTLGASLAAAGLLSGAGPDFGTRDREALTSNGWKPFSLKVGENWVPVQNILGPFGFALMLPAMAYDAVKAGEVKNVRTGDAELAKTEMVSQAGRALGEYFVNSIGLKTVADFYEKIMRNPDQWEDFVSDFAASWAPYTGLGGQIARMTDDTVRDPHSMWESIMARTPGASQTVPAKLDSFGEPVKRAFSGAQLLLPIGGAGKESQDPVRRELLRLQQAGFDVQPMPVGGQFSVLEGSSFRLEDDEKRQYQQGAGKYTQQFLSQLINSPHWKDVPDYVKAELIGEFVQEAREIGREMMITPDIVNRAVQQQEGEWARKGMFSLGN